MVNKKVNAECSWNSISLPLERQNLERKLNIFAITDYIKGKILLGLVKNTIKLDFFPFPFW